MSRRDLFFKWSVYALGLLLVWMVDFHILPFLPTLGISPMLLPVAVAVVAVLEGSRGGAGFGMGVGLAWELLYPGGSGGLVIAMALAGMLAGSISQFALRRSFLGSLLCSALILVLLDGCRVLGGLLNGLAPLGSMLPLALGEIALSLLWPPLIYLLFSRIYRRVGGSKLA